MRCVDERARVIAGRSVQFLHCLEFAGERPALNSLVDGAHAVAQLDGASRAAAAAAVDARRPTTHRLHEGRAVALSDRGPLLGRGARLYQVCARAAALGAVALTRGRSIDTVLKRDAYSGQVVQLRYNNEDRHTLRLSAVDTLVFYDAFLRVRCAVDRRAADRFAARDAAGARVARGQERRGV